MAFSPCFVAHADHAHSRRVLELLRRHGVEAHLFSSDELPPELLRPHLRIRLVTCFDSPGNYPGNYLRVLQSADVAPGNKYHFVVPQWTRPIKLDQRVAIRQITPQEYDVRRFTQAVHTMYRDVTDVRIPREVSVAPTAVGGGYHLPRDTWHGNDDHVAV